MGDEPQFNYTYVNYVGRSTYKGFPGTDRESPALVSEAMAELKGVYPISHYFVGGHSQGGYLTYSLLMNFPESMAGAFPISCELIFQCEPEAYTDSALREAQRKVPLAIIHGKTDPLVGFAGGQYAATVFGDAGWPAFRFFADDRGAHMFARLPVGPAIRWLEAHTSNNPAALLDFAKKRLGEGGYRDAIAALRRVRDLKLDAGQKRRADELARTIAIKAAPGAAKYLKLVRAAKDNSWIDGFLAYRDDFEFADDAPRPQRPLPSCAAPRRAGQDRLQRGAAAFPAAKARRGVCQVSNDCRVLLCFPALSHRQALAGGAPLSG